MSAYLHTHLWERDPVAWHCIHRGCTAATTEPYVAAATTYGWGSRHSDGCSGLRVDPNGACTLCGEPRGIPPFPMTRV